MYYIVQYIILYSLTEDLMSTHITDRTYQQML